MVDHTKSHTIKYSPIPYFILDKISVMRERLLVPLLYCYSITPMIDAGEIGMRHVLVV